MTKPNGPWRSPRPARERPWLMRTYAGHSSAKESNALYRRNLAKGQTGLSVAFDLPTQMGYDADHVLARGEVGRVGVPVGHLGDMRALFDGIPLEQTNTSMTINATAMWLLALYQVAAEEQGADIAKLTGTTQNDIIKEYLSRGTYVFPPGPSVRLTTDVIAYTVARMPKWNPVNVCSYHLQEAGATPVQEIAYALCTAMTVLDAVRDGGQVPRSGWARSSGGCPSSSTRASASSRRCARCGPSPGSGTRSPGSGTRSPTPRAAASATACRSTRSA
jgi:(2R)-ethylmalonyl-CoA mutase